MGEYREFGFRQAITVTSLSLPDPLIDRLIDQLIDWLIACVVDWLFACLLV